MLFKSVETNFKPVGRAGNFAGLSAFSVFTFFGCVLILSIFLFPLLNFQIFKSESSSRTLKVSYWWPNAPDIVIENEVTSKLEALLSSIKGVQNINSESGRGYGVVEVELKKNVNIDITRFEISNIIRQTNSSFPPQVSYPIISSSSSKSDEPLMQYSLDANLDLNEIEKYANSVILPSFSRITDVADIRVLGGLNKNWLVTFDINLMNSLHISSDEVISSVTDYFEREFVGISEDSNNSNRINVVLQGNRDLSATWSKIIIKNSSGRIIHLKDVADVEFLDEEPLYYHRNNGKNGITILVYASKNSNKLNLAKLIRANAINIESKLPKGITLNLFYDSTESPSKEIFNTIQYLILLLILQCIFILLYFKDIKVVFFILSCSIFIFSLATILFVLFKVNISLLSIHGGFVLIGLISNSILLYINYLKNHIKHHLSIFIGSLIAPNLVMLSVFLLTHDELFHNKEFTLIVLIISLSSIAVSTFIAPQLFARLGAIDLKRSKQRVSFPFFKYYFILKYLRKRNIIIIFMVALIFGLPFNVNKHLPKDNNFTNSIEEFSGRSTTLNKVLKIAGGSLRLFLENVPKNQRSEEASQTTLYINGSMDAGGTMKQLNKVFEELESFINQYPQVKSFQTSIQNYKSGKLLVYLDRELDDSEFPVFFKNQIENKVISLGGVKWTIYGIGRGFSNETGFSFNNNEILLEGYDYYELLSYAEYLKTLLEKNRRISNIQISGKAGINSVSVIEHSLTFNSEKLAFLDSKKSELLNDLSALAGNDFRKVISIDSQIYQVLFHSKMSANFSSWDLSNQKINNSNLSVKSVGGVIDSKENSNGIFRKNQQYQLFVGYSFTGTPELSKNLLDESILTMKEKLPIGYFITAAEGSDWVDLSNNDILVYLLTFVFIYFLSAMLLESFTQPLAIICLILFAFSGVFLSFYFTNENFDQGGFFSFYFIAGVVLQWALILLQEYNRKAFFYEYKFKFFLLLIAKKIKLIAFSNLMLVSSFCFMILSLNKMSFWYSFSIGCLGGLFFTFIGLIILLPTITHLKSTKLYSENI